MEEKLSGLFPEMAEKTLESLAHFYGLSKDELKKLTPDEFEKKRQEMMKSIPLPINPSGFSYERSGQVMKKTTNGTWLGEFFVGDTAVLNSGGPDMTVVGVDRHNDEVLCKWSNAGGTTYETFRIKTIRRVPHADKTKEA